MIMMKHFAALSFKNMSTIVIISIFLILILPCNFRLLSAVAK